MTFKRYMYYIFLMVFDIYSKKEHLTPQGFMLCVAYINSLNKAIKPQVLSTITGSYGPLPELVLPLIPTSISYTLNPY